MTKVDLLKRCAYFRELNDEQLKQLSSMAHEEVYEVGGDLTKQGRFEDKIYVIEEGLVGLYLEMGPMSHHIIQSASNYEIVGWGSILEPPHRSTVTAKAIETTKVLSFYGEELKRLCETDPQIGCRVHRAIIAVVTTRLKNAYTQLMGVTIQDYS